MLHYFKFHQIFYRPCRREVYVKRGPGRDGPRNARRSAPPTHLDLICSRTSTSPFFRLAGRWRVQKDVVIDSDFHYAGSEESEGAPLRQQYAWFWEKGQRLPHPISDNVYREIQNQVKVSSYLFLKTDPNELLFMTDVPNLSRPWRAMTALIDTDWYPASYPWHCVIELDPREKRISIKKGEPLCRVIPVRRDTYFAAEMPARNSTNSSPAARTGSGPTAPCSTRGPWTSPAPTDANRSNRGSYGFRRAGSFVQVRTTAPSCSAGRFDHVLNRGFNLLAGERLGGGAEDQRDGDALLPGLQRLAPISGHVLEVLHPRRLNAPDQLSHALVANRLRKDQGNVAAHRWKARQRAKLRDTLSAAEQQLQLQLGRRRRLAKTEFLGDPSVDHTDETDELRPPTRMRRHAPGA